MTFSNKAFSTRGMSRAKRVAISAAITAAGLCAMSAHAEESATLSIKGTIAPAACTPAFSGGGMIDHGTVISSSLDKTDTTILPAKRVTLTVSCDAPARVAWTVTDNRSGTAVSGVTYSPNPNNGATVIPNGELGLGLDRSGNKIGAIRLISVNGTGTIDGTPALVMYRQPSSTTWSTMTVGAVHPEARQYGLSLTENSEPSPMTIGSLEYDIATTINKHSKLDLSDEVTLDGNATFTLLYL